MASEGSSSAIVAIFAIIMLVLVGGAIAWKMGAFSGEGGSTTHKIQIETPTK